MEFGIELDNRPHLKALLKEDKEAFKTIVGTFVNVMELAAEKKWYDLPETIHTSLSFDDVVMGVLNAIMTTREIDKNAFSALESGLHPLSLISDKRKDMVTQEDTLYDWKKHFALDTNEVSRGALEHIIRKILYLVRWFDIESVSKALITQTFPVIDAKDVMKLPFQPALQYQQDHLSELHVGKFFHDIGAFDAGTIDENVTHCLACKIGDLQPVYDGTFKVCPRCNAGFEIIEKYDL